MTATCKTNGSIGTRSVIGVLQVTALLVGAILIHKIDSATEKNSVKLAQHSEKLAIHTDQIDTLSKLVNAQFTPKEASKITSLYEKQLNEKR